MSEPIETDSRLSGNSGNIGDVIHETDYNNAYGDAEAANVKHTDQSSATRCSADDSVNTAERESTLESKDETTSANINMSQQSDINNQKTYVARTHSLEYDLSGDGIAEIYLGNVNGQLNTEKGSAGTDSNISEMASSIGQAEELDCTARSVSPHKNNEESSHDDCGLLPNNTHTALNGNKQSQNVVDICTETKKRPLSPTDIMNENIEHTNKRIKSEGISYEDTNADAGENKHSGSDGIVDICPPVAIVAPLGFGEDIFINTSPTKDTKSETDCVKNDISSLLDSLDQSDDKTQFLFDSAFERMKSDIFAGQSFKTMDGNNWTFHGKSLDGGGKLGKIINQGTGNDEAQLQSMLRVDSDMINRPQFKRANSVEHDIKDFEKVLNSVIEKANKDPRPNESLSQLFSSKLPLSGMDGRVFNKQCHQPCTHISNSDLLRELLDQKNDNSNTQNKTRHEIDLSFLHSDLISGKGLSVSSDKILQTRTIDPRLTSIPHIDRPSSEKQTRTMPTQCDSSRYDTNVVHMSSQNSHRLLEGDPISLAEQRRASVTLHHKVPANDAHDQQNHVVNTFGDRDDLGTSNIIKEAFDFATELSDNMNVGGNSSYQNKTDTSLPLDPLFQEKFGINRRSYPRSQEVHSQYDRYRNTNNNDQIAKLDHVQNRQMLRNDRLPDMYSNSGLLTFANINEVDSETNRPPQLAGPFVKSALNATARPNEHWQSIEQRQRSHMFSNKLETMSTQVDGFPMNNVEQQLKIDTGPIQNPTMRLGNQVHRPSMRQMERSMAQKQHPGTEQHVETSMVQKQYPGTGHIDTGSLQNQHPGMGHMDTAITQKPHQIHPSGFVTSHMPDMQNSQTFQQDSRMQHNRSDRSMMPPENYPMGMQERIRAMNVQQWYRRRMQAQMNRPTSPQAQYMMRQQLAEGHTVGPHQKTQGYEQRVGLQGMRSRNLVHEQRMAPNQMPMHAQHGMFNNSYMGNPKMHQSSLSQGREQVKYESHNRGNVEYQHHMNHQNTDTEIQNSVQLARTRSIGGYADGTTGSNVSVGQRPYQFDMKQEPQTSQPPLDVTFPFNM